MTTNQSRDEANVRVDRSERKLRARLRRRARHFAAETVSDGEFNQDAQEAFLGVLCEQTRLHESLHERHVRRVGDGQILHSSPFVEVRRNLFAQARGIGLTVRMRTRRRTLGRILAGVLRAVGDALRRNIRRQRWRRTWRWRRRHAWIRHRRWRWLWLSERWLSRESRRRARGRRRSRRCARKLRKVVVDAKSGGGELSRSRSQRLWKRRRVSTLHDGRIKERLIDTRLTMLLTHNHSRGERFIDVSNRLLGRRLFNERATQFEIVNRRRLHRGFEGGCLRAGAGT